ncbi:MAG: TerB family tellurite resistance protein [Pseudomonadales bacterium]|nr:TerB family tellurite resistance protein [Pseudomonadales bacterium]
MLDRLLSIFAETEDAEPQLSVELAAAALMFEVIWADHEIKEDEIGELRSHLTRLFAIDDKQFTAILRETRRLHDESVGLHQFTTALNDTLDRADKYEIVSALWRIAYADDQLDVLEEHIVRRIADLLYVSHKDFIRAKLAARDSK